jgi:hypothetical protein
MLITDRINALPAINLASTTINLSELFTKREKPLLIQMGALAFGASIVAGLALAGVTVLLAPEILATACIVGGIALFVLGIKMPSKCLMKLKAILLERKIAQLVKAIKQENVNLKVFNGVHSRILDSITSFFDTNAQEKLKQLMTVLLIFKNIAKAQEHLKPAGQHHLAIHFLAQAAHELNNSQSMNANLKDNLIAHIAVMSNQMIPLMKSKIIQIREGIPKELAGEGAYKELDSMLTDTLGIRPTTIAELTGHFHQQRVIFDILKCIEFGQNLIKKSKNELLQQNGSTITDAETRRALIYLSDAERELQTTSLHQFAELFLPVVTELKDAIVAIRYSHKNTLSSSATVIQRRWRSRFRRRLLKNNQTFEDWRIQAADKETLAVFPAALKRKAMFSNTHIVFTHGQSSKVSVLNDLVKALTKTFTPEKYRPHAPGFRIPELVPRADNVEEFFTRHPVITDNLINNEVLSADAFFNNRDNGESAQHYYSSDSNVSTNVQPRAFTILHHYLAQSGICQTLAQKIEGIATRKYGDGGGGVFHTICVPKVVINDPKRNYAYRSHAFGRACTCHPKEEDAKILDDLQKDIPHMCGSSNPQYRLVTSAFSRDTSVRSFAFSGRSKAKEEEYRKEIQDVALELHVYARLINLAAPPTDVELAALNKDIQTLTALPNFDQSTLTPLLAQKQAFMQIAL